MNVLIMIVLLIGGATFVGQKLGFWHDTQNVQHQGQIIKQQNKNDGVCTDPTNSKNKTK